MAQDRQEEQEGWILKTRVIGKADITGCDMVQLHKDSGGKRVDLATRFTFNFAFPTYGPNRPQEKEYAILVDGNQMQYSRQGKVEIIELKAGPSISHVAAVRVPSGSFIHAGIFTKPPKE